MIEMMPLEGKINQSLLPELGSELFPELVTLG